MKRKGAAAGKICYRCSKPMVWQQNNQSKEFFPACPDWRQHKAERSQPLKVTFEVDTSGLEKYSDKDLSEIFKALEDGHKNFENDIEKESKERKPVELVQESIKAEQYEKFFSKVGDFFFEAVGEKPKAKKALATKKALTSGSIEDMILDAIMPHVAELAENVLTKKIQENMDFGVKSIEWKINDVQLGKLERRPHRSLNEVMRRVKANLQNLLLVGPAGSGKTTLAKDLADALKLGFSAISCSEAMSEHVLMGRLTPNITTGEEKYQIVEFVKIFRDGGVFLLDEIDASNANVLVALNSAVANGFLTIPTGERVKRHKDCYIVAAANTYGQGADAQYVGRNALDAATLDRFAGAVIRMEYDVDLEKELVPEGKVRDTIWTMRKKVQDLKLRRVLGTRALLAAAALVRSGETLKDAVDALLVGWTPDEVTRVLPKGL